MGIFFKNPLEKRAEIYYNVCNYRFFVKTNGKIGFERIPLPLFTSQPTDKISFLTQGGFIL